jgi:hypothetical protein
MYATGHLAPSRHFSCMQPRRFVETVGHGVAENGEYGDHKSSGALLGE